MHVLIVYNIPSLPTTDPDYAQEAGVLEAVAVIDAALTSRGYHVELCGLINAASLGERLSLQLRPDVVVNLCEGFDGRGEGESQVAQLLEQHGLPFTGSGSKCLTVARDKAATKHLLMGAGLPTPSGCVVRPGDSFSQPDFEPLLQLGPVIVKPATEDASLGIGPKSVCHDWRSLALQIEQIREQFGIILVEQFIAGREFNAAIVALPEPRCLPLAEIGFAETLSTFERLITYDAKWLSGSAADCATPVCCPADISLELNTAIERAVLKAFHTLGCRDYARVDIRVDDYDQLFILEVNANPDISPSAGLVRSLGVAGVQFDEFVVSVVENALRHDLPL